MDSKMPIEEPYAQFKNREAIVSVDAENMTPCKPYKKKISDMVKEPKSNI